MTEHFFVILGGIPDLFCDDKRLYDYLYSQPSYKLGSGDCKIIISPLSPSGDGNYRYQERHRDELLERLYLEFVPIAKANLGAEMYIFLIYVDYGDAHTGEFTKAFAPFALCHRIPPMRQLVNSRRAFYDYRNQLVVRIKEATRRLRHKVGVVKRELNNHRSTTPLLLPIVNFDSKIFVDLVHQAATSLSLMSDVVAGLERLRNDFDKVHDRMQVGEKRFYKDDRKLVFKAPPDRLLHGQNLRGNTVHGGEGHLEICAVTSRTRLGAPYKSTFYYDCELESGRRVTREFIGCHLQRVKAQRWTHVNIAPNDWVG